MFVFYDIETTGVNLSFDQILQFAAILTDDNLNEIERFEIRCQLLPWVIPSPEALIVTKTSTEKLNDASLPTFFEMIRKIHEKLESWSPAIFIGYNSYRFDEVFLHRAFWQTLLPPYLTVTNGNSRYDLLPLVRAVFLAKPEALRWVLKDDGGYTFKLDKLAPLNGFAHNNAHDALNDVEATIHIAKLLFNSAPELWSTIISRTNKTQTHLLLNTQEPVYIFEYIAGKPTARFGISVNAKQGAEVTLAILSYNWKFSANSGILLTDEGAIEANKNLKTIPLNKFPVIFSRVEAQKLFGAEINDQESEQLSFLLETETYERLELLFKPKSKEYPKNEELEQMIYDRFASQEDEIIMRDFHKADLSQKAEIMRKFTDKRFYHLAIRILYICAPNLLNYSELERVKKGIRNRLNPVQSSRPWRSLNQAMHELSTLSAKYDSNLILKLYNWFLELKYKYSD